MIAASLVWGLAGIAGAVPAMFSVMLFDAPGSESNVATIVFAACMAGFPIACFVAIAQGWAHYRSGRHQSTALCACAPLVVLALGGASYAWIALMQGGKLNG